RLPNVDHAHYRNGRTSTFRLQLFDPSAASLSAMSRSGASMIQKPARYSFDSTKGPSLNTASPSRLSMTVAVLGDPRPAAKTQWPSARSRSLNASMAAISVGVAEPVLSSMTETRYCIRDHLLWFRGRPSWATAAPLLRTPLPRSDMPPGSRARCSCPYAVFRGGQMSSDTVSLLDGDTFVVCDRRGDVVPSGSEPHGLFLQDTRFLSCWRLTVDGSSPKVLSTDDVNYFSAQFFLVPPAESHYDQASFSIMRKRSVGRGFHEDIAVLNHTTEPLDLVLQIEA